MKKEHNKSVRGLGGVSAREAGERLLIRNEPDAVAVIRSKPGLTVAQVQAMINSAIVAALVNYPTKLQINALLVNIEYLDWTSTAQNVDVVANGF